MVRLGRRSATCASVLTVLLTLSAPAADPPLPKDLVLPEGHKPFTFRNVQSPTAGFILPGSRVNVALIEKLEKGKVRINVVHENALVVVVETRIDPKADEKKDPEIAVTVAVKPEDVKKLEAARKKGEFRLLLRAPSDEKKDAPNP